MKRASTPISVRSGNIEFLKVNSVVWEWRDLYQWLVSLSWSWFALFLMGSYLAVNVLFAALYTLVPGGIAEMRPGSFVDSFFFSVETLATVGYGHMYPASLAGHLIATAEIVLGMFGMAVVTGLIFVRFSRPAAKIVFSRNLVVSRFDGKPTLMMRVGNQRHRPMVEVNFRIMMIRTETTEGGEEIARFHELRLEVEGVVVFPAAMTVRHPIDKQSPLYGLTAAELEKESTRFVASVVCVDTVVAASVQSYHDYRWQDVRFGERFAEIYTEAPGDGKWVVDYGRLHETEPTVERG
jgi:inward rectifier potassium channel